MKLDVVRQEVWAACIEGRAGGLAERLQPLAQAGVNLEFIIARRSSEKKGTGVVFVTPIKGARQIKAARQAGFAKASSLHSLRVSANDKPELAACLTRELAEVGISLRGFSGAAVGRRAVFNLAFNSSEDATKAMRRLGKIS